MDDRVRPAQHSVDEILETVISPDDADAARKYAVIKLRWGLGEIRHTLLEIDERLGLILSPKKELSLRASGSKAQSIILQINAALQTKGSLKVFCQSIIDTTTGLNSGDVHSLLDMYFESKRGATGSSKKEKESGEVVLLRMRLMRRWLDALVSRKALILSPLAQKSSRPIRQQSQSPLTPGQR